MLKNDKIFIKPDLLNIVMSIMLALCISIITFKYSDTVLTGFPDRSIGVAIINGIDPSKRSLIYIKLILCFLISFFITLFFINFLNNILKKQIKEFYTKVEKKTLLFLSCVNVVTIYLYILSKEKLFSHITVLLYFLIFISFSVIIFKTISYIKYQSLKLFPGYNIIIAFLFIPPVIFFIISVFFRIDFILTSWYFLWYSLILIILFIMYHIIRKDFLNKVLFDRIIIFSLVPFIFIPVSIPMSNELQFTISNLTDRSPRFISAIIIFILLILSSVIFIKCIKKKRVPTSSYIIGNIYFPVLLATLSVFYYHTHSLIFNDIFDLHHTSERVISTQQLFQFNKIPFVDILPAHGLSDMFFQIIYSLINGYRGIEVLLWNSNVGFGNWLYNTSGIIFLYFLFKRLYNPLFSLLVIGLLPVGTYFYSGYYFSLIPFIAMYWLLKKPTFFRFNLFWCVILFTGLWTPAFGAGVLPSSIVILLLYHSLNKEVKWKNTVLSLFIVMGSSFILYLILLVMRGKSVLDTFTLIINYMKADSANFGHVNIIKDYNALAVFQYFILPSISLFYIAFTVIKMLKRDTLKSNMYILLFMSICSLILLLRGFARHGLIEMYNPYYFVLLIFTLPLMFNRAKKFSPELIFLGLYLVYISIFPCYSTLIKEGKIFEYRKWHKKESRIVINNTSQYRELKNFFNKYMDKNQTFYEFIMAHFLYVFTERKLPYFNLSGTPVYGSDKSQIICLKDLKGLYEKNELPFVIFRDSEWWGDEVDDIPNSVRCYRIAEFIYKNYKPLGTIHTYDIWVANNFNKSIDRHENSISLTLKNNDNTKLNDIVKANYKENKFSLICGNYDPYIYNFIHLEGLNYLDTNKYWSLKIKYRSSREGDLQVFYSLNNIPFNEEDSIKVKVIATDNENSVEVPVLLSIEKNKLCDIRFDPPYNSEFKIEGIELIQKDNNLIALNNTVQHFNLMKLPYIWGNYDTKKASDETKILWEKEINKFLGTNEVMEINFPSRIDKSTGNYLHLRLKSDSYVRATITYGNNIKSSFTFDIIPSKKVENYLIRISSQWLWNSESIKSITIKSDNPLWIDQILIRKGD